MDFFNGIHQYGIMNYVDAFSTPKITKALITTFKYSFITVPLKLVFALFIAYILNFKIACVNVFRTVYYIPSILGGSVAIAVLWKAVFRDDGLVNTLIRMLTFGHFQGPSWLSDPSYAPAATTLPKFPPTLPASPSRLPRRQQAARAALRVALRPATPKRVSTPPTLRQS